VGLQSESLQKMAINKPELERSPKRQRLTETEGDEEGGQARMELEWRAVGLLVGN
jgi:hypothetical protein